MKIKTYLLLVLLALMGMPALAQTSNMEFSYCDDNANVSLFGTGKKDVYDVAIRLNSPELVGTTIQGVCVYIPKSDSICNFSVWMSKSLTLDGDRVNQPDVCKQSAELSKAFNEEYIAFDEPYTITAEGIYVGYSFTVTAYDSVTAAPLPVCDNSAPGGFYIHTKKKYYGWMDKSSEIGNLAFNVMLSNVPNNSASVSLPQTVYTVRDKQTTADVTLVNHGAKGVQSVELTYTINGESSSQTVTLPSDSVLPGKFGASTTYGLVLPALADDGEYPVTVSVTKVNGADNSYSLSSDSTSLDVRAFIPHHNVVLEEFTGAWCGNCPRGNASIKILKRVHPDNFIALAYHNKDGMEVMSAKQFPSSVSQFPSCTLDRGDLIDPYFGSSNPSPGYVIPFAINKDVIATEKVYAQANMEATATLSEDGSEVDVSASATFPRAIGHAGYRVEYVLLANGLQGTGSMWDQVNYLSGADVPYFPQPEFEPFIKGAETLTGFVYDDVVIATTRLSGNDVSLPSVLEAYTPYPTSAHFSLIDLIEADKADVIQDLTKLDVVALLIDVYTERVVNAAQAKVDASAYVAASVGSVKADSNNVVRVSYTDLSGRSVSKPAHGVFVETTHYADGTSNSRKTVR